MRQLIIILVGMFFMLNAEATCDLVPKFSYATKSKSVNFTDKSEGAIASYLWTFGDGTSSREASPKHTYTQGGMYIFSLTVSNEEGCSETFEGKVYVFDIKQTDKPKGDSTTPDVEKQDVVEEVIDEIAFEEAEEKTLEQNESNVQVYVEDELLANNKVTSEQSEVVKEFSNYPNPFVNATNIQFHLNKDGHVSVSVHNMAGKLVSVVADEFMYSGTHQLRFERNGLPEGYYLATIISEEETLSHKMLIQ